MKRIAIHSDRGFTLIELVVVISVIAVLVTIVIGVSTLVIAKAGVEQTKLNMGIIRQAIEAYRETDSSGGYPLSSAANPQDRNNALFFALTGNPAAKAKLASLPGDAIKNIDDNDYFVDGFGGPLDYEFDGGAGGTPVLISAGADSNFNTGKDNIRSDGQ